MVVIVSVVVVWYVNSMRRVWEGLFANYFQAFLPHHWKLQPANEADLEMLMATCVLFKDSAKVRFICVVSDRDSVFSLAIVYVFTLLVSCWLLTSHVSIIYRRRWLLRRKSVAKLHVQRCWQQSAVPYYSSGKRATLPTATKTSVSQIYYFDTICAA